MVTEKSITSAAIVEPTVEAETMVNEVVEQPAEVAEETPVEEDVAAGRTKEQLLDRLACLVEEEQVQNVRQDVEAVKVAFYKIYRAEADARRRAFFEEHGEEAEYKPEADASELRFKELYKIYRERRDEYAALTERAKEDNLRAKLAIIEELKALVGGEETLNVTFAKFHELQAAWRAVGQVPQANVKDLWETYNLHVECFYDFVKINKELRDLDWKRNLETKVALCEQAEALAEATAVVEAFHKLQKLHEEWRETGPVAPDQKEGLWARFKAASTIVNRRHQEYFEAVKSEQLANFERKSALCERIEALAKEELTTVKAWNKASQQLLDTQTEWRTIGFAPKRDNTKVYDRFRKACNAFFERKRAYYAEVKEGMGEALRLKESLCERAEALQQSEDWNATTEALIALQAEWKAAGQVSRRHADDVWKRFRKACDTFFERKSAHFASVDKTHNANLDAKRALIEELKGVAAEGCTFELIKEYQRRWSEIGFVPIKHKERLFAEYKEQLDRLFTAVRGAGREQAMGRFKERVSTMRASGDKRLRSERERLYNRVRQLEQEISTLENNVGFFAKSKGAEVLIAEVQQKIERAKREREEVIAKVQMIDNGQ